MSETPTIGAPIKSSIKSSPPDAAKGLTIFVLVVTILYIGKPVLVPITLALLLAFLVAPVVAFVRRLGVGRVPSVVLSVVLALGVVSAVGSVIGMQVSSLTNELPQYAAAIEKKLAVAQDYTLGRISRFAGKLGPRSSRHSVEADGAHAHPGTPQSDGEVLIVQPAAAPIAIAEQYFASAIAPITAIGIVFIVTVFALLQRQDLRNRLIRLAGSHDLHNTTIAIDDAARRLSRYYLTQLIINAIFGSIITVGLLLIGVPSPALWGILSGALRFVPYIGLPISAVIPLMLAAAVQPGWTAVAETVGLYLIIGPLTGQIVEPLIYGNSTGLTPFSVVVSAIFWSWVWGPVGLFLSTPLTLCLVVIGRHVERLEFLDVVLGDTPALTPVEAFYQRTLADDPDEAQDEAELLLAEISLSTYYDEVVVKGLRRAAGDASRGAINAQQLDRVRRAVATLIEGLELHADHQPSEEKPAVAPPVEPEAPAIAHHPDPLSIFQDRDELTEAWRHQPAVLCIAGRGPLDELVAAMMVQLLGKHGMNARAAPYAEVSRGRVLTLETEGIAMACICYLEIDGTPAHLRNLVNRLRRNLPPELPILIGLRPASNVRQDNLTLGLPVLDMPTTSLEESVSACAEVALAAGASHHAGLQRLG